MLCYAVRFMDLEHHNQEMLSKYIRNHEKKMKNAETGAVRNGM